MSHKLAPRLVQQSINNVISAAVSEWGEVPCPEFVGYVHTAILEDNVYVGRVAALTLVMGGEEAEIEPGYWDNKVPDALLNKHPALNQVLLDC